MTSQLAKQLQRLQLDAVADSSRNSSFLFSKADAQSYSREQILQLAIEGLQSLVALENRIHPFIDKLFLRSQTRQERSMLTVEANKSLDDVLDRFLTLLSPHLFLTCAQQVFEYLVRVHEVHVYNVMAVLRAFLPYHDHNIFARVLLLLDLRDTGFQFLSVNQERGAPLLREHLVLVCAESRKALRLVCSAMAMSVRMQVIHNAAYALFASVACRLATHEDAESHWRILLPYVMEFIAVGDRHLHGGERAEAASALAAEDASSLNIHTELGEASHTRMYGASGVGRAHDPAARETLSTGLLVLAAWATSVRFSSTLLTTVMRRLIHVLRQESLSTGSAAPLLWNVLMLTNLLVESHREVVTQTTFTPVLRVLVDLPWARWSDGVLFARREAYGRLDALTDVLIRYCLKRVRVAHSMHSVPSEVLFFLSFGAERLPLPVPLVRRTLRLLFTLDHISGQPGHDEGRANSSHRRAKHGVLPDEKGNDDDETLPHDASFEVGDESDENLVRGESTSCATRRVAADAAVLTCETFCRTLAAALERRYPDVFDHTLALALRRGSASATAFVSRHLGGEARYSVVQLTGRDTHASEGEETQRCAHESGLHDEACSSDVALLKAEQAHTHEDGDGERVPVPPPSVSELPLFACLLHRHPDIRILGASALRRMSLQQLLYSSVQSERSSATPRAPHQRITTTTTTTIRGNSLMELLTHVMSYEQEERVAAHLIRVAAAVLRSLASVIYVHTAQAAGPCDKESAVSAQCDKSGVSVSEAMRAYTHLLSALPTLVPSQGCFALVERPNGTLSSSPSTSSSSMGLRVSAPASRSVQALVAAEVYVPLLRDYGELTPSITPLLHGTTTAAQSKTATTHAADEKTVYRHETVVAQAQSVLLYRAIQFYLSLGDVDGAGESGRANAGRETRPASAASDADTRQAVRRVMADALHRVCTPSLHASRQSTTATTRTRKKSNTMFMNDSSTLTGADKESDEMSSSTAWQQATDVSEMLSLVCRSPALLAAIRPEAHNRLASALTAAHELLLDARRERDTTSSHPSERDTAATAAAAPRRVRRRNAVCAEICLSVSACLLARDNDTSGSAGVGTLATDALVHQTVRTLLRFLLGEEDRSSRAADTMTERQQKGSDAAALLSMLPSEGYLLRLQESQRHEGIAGTLAATQANTNTNSAKVGRHAENSTAALTRSFLPHDAVTHALAGIVHSTIARLLSESHNCMSHTNTATEQTEEKDDSNDVHVVELTAMLLRLFGCLGSPAPPLHTHVNDILARAYFVLLDHTASVAPTRLPGETSHATDAATVTRPQETNMDTMYARLALDWPAWVQEAIFGAPRSNDNNNISKRKSNRPAADATNDDHTIMPHSALMTGTRHTSLCVSPAALALTLFAPLCSSSFGTPAATPLLAMLRDALHHTGTAPVYDIIAAVSSTAPAQEGAAARPRRTPKSAPNNTTADATNTNSVTRHEAGDAHAMHLSAGAVADVLATLNDPSTPLASAGCALVCDLLALQSGTGQSVRPLHTSRCATGAHNAVTAAQRSAHNRKDNNDEEGTTHEGVSNRRGGHYVIPWSMATLIVTRLFPHVQSLSDSSKARLHLSHGLLARLLTALSHTRDTVTTGHTWQAPAAAHSYAELADMAHFVLTVAQRCRLEPAGPPPLAATSGSARVHLDECDTGGDATSSAVVQFCAALLLPLPHSSKSRSTSSSLSRLPPESASMSARYVSAALTMIAMGFHAWNVSCSAASPASVPRAGAEGRHVWLQQAQRYLYPRVWHSFTRCGSDVVRMCLTTRGGYGAFFLPLVDAIRGKATDLQRRCSDTNKANGETNTREAEERSDLLHRGPCSSASSKKSRRATSADGRRPTSAHISAPSRSPCAAAERTSEERCATGSGLAELTATEWEALEMCMEYLAPASLSESFGHAHTSTHSITLASSWQAPSWCRLSTHAMHYRTACDVMDVCATCLDTKPHTHTDGVDTNAEEYALSSDCNRTGAWKRTAGTLSALRILRALLRTLPSIVYDDQLCEPYMSDDDVEANSASTRTTPHHSRRGHRRGAKTAVWVPAGESDSDDDTLHAPGTSRNDDEAAVDALPPPSPRQLMERLMHRFALPALAPLLRTPDSLYQHHTPTAQPTSSSVVPRESSLPSLGAAATMSTATLSSRTSLLVTNAYARQALLFFTDVVHGCTAHTRLLAEPSRADGAAARVRLTAVKQSMWLMSGLLTHPSSAPHSDEEEQHAQRAHMTNHEADDNNNRNHNNDNNADGAVSDVIAALLRGMTPLLTQSSSSAAASSMSFALHIPLLALLIRMESVDGTAALRFRRAWEVCQDILLSLDVQQQLLCLTQMMRLLMDPHTHVAELAARQETSAGDGESNDMAHVFRKMVKPNQIINRQETILNMINTAVKSERFLAPFIERQRRAHATKGAEKDDDEEDATRTLDTDKDSSPPHLWKGGSGDACTDLLVCALEMYAHYTDLNAAVATDAVVHSGAAAAEAVVNHRTTTTHTDEHDTSAEAAGEPCYSEDKSYAMLLELLSGNTLACILAGINESTFVLCLRRLLHDPRPALRLRGLEALLDRLHHALPTGEYTITDAAMRQRRAELRDPRRKLTLMDLVQVRARPLTTKRSFALFPRLQELMHASLDALTALHEKNSDDTMTQTTLNASVRARNVQTSTWEQCLLTAQRAIACAEELVRMVGSGGSLQAEKTLLNVHRSRRVTESTLTKLFGNKSRLRDVHAFVQSLYMHVLPQLARCMSCNAHHPSRASVVVHAVNEKTPARTHGHTHSLSEGYLAVSRRHEEGIMAVMATVMTALGSTIQVMGAAATSAMHGDALLRAVVYEVARQLHTTQTIHTNERRTYSSEEALAASPVTASALLRQATLATLIRAFPLYWQLSYPYLSAMLYCATHRRNVDDAETRYLCDELVTLLEAVLEPGVFVEAAAACLRGITVEPNSETTNTTKSTTRATNDAGNPIKNGAARTSEEENEEKESKKLTRKNGRHGAKAQTTKSLLPLSCAAAATPLRTWHVRIRVATHSLAFFYAAIQRRVGAMKKEELMLMPFLTRGTRPDDNFWLSSLDMLVRTAVTSGAPAVLSSSEAVMPVLQAYTTFFLKFRARRCAGFIRAVAEWVFGHGTAEQQKRTDNNEEDSDDDGEVDRAGDETAAALQHASRRARKMSEGSRPRRSPARAAGAAEEKEEKAAAATPLHACLVFYALINHLLDSLGGIFDFAFPVVVPYLVSTLTGYQTDIRAAASAHRRVTGGERAATSVVEDGHDVSAGGVDARSIADSLTALCLEEAMGSVRRMALAQIPGPDYDYSIPLDVYFATPEVFNSVMPALIHQLHNTEYLTDSVHDFRFRAEHAAIPAVRAFFRCLNSHSLQSKTQAEMVRSLRHPDRHVRQVVLRCLDGVYADGGEELAARLMAEMLPAVVELTEDSSTAVVEEARTLCTNLSHMTGQDVLHAMS